MMTLLQKASQTEWSSLVSGYNMLMSPEQMGERFKFMSIMPKLTGDYTPAGFVDLDLGQMSNKTE
uniref:Uncharacterized protein n=1 Tax=Arion vulgaris TaxID=1028688 RepID=A0A0B6ZBR9_9EUPU